MQVPTENDCYNVYREGKDGKVERLDPEEGARILGFNMERKEKRSVENGEKLHEEENFMFQIISKNPFYSLISCFVIMIAAFLITTQRLNNFSLLDLNSRFNTFPLFLISWRTLSWMKAQFIMNIMQLTNMFFIICSSFIIHFTIGSIYDYITKSREEPNHFKNTEKALQFFITLAFALGTCVWFIVSNQHQTVSYGIILLFVCLQNYFLMKILFNHEIPNSIYGSVLAIFCVILVCYDSLCTSFLLCASVSLMIIDYRKDPTYATSFTFLGTVGGILVLVVFWLRITKDDSINQASQYVEIGDSPSTEYAGIFSIIKCIIEGTFGNLISPSRGILIFSPFLIVPLCSGIFFVYDQLNIKKSLTKISEIILFLNCIVSSLLFVLLYVITSCSSMDIQYLQNVKAWIGWWGGHQVGNINLVIIVPSLTLLCSSIFILPNYMKKYTYYIFLSLILISVFIHGASTLTSANEGILSWNTKETFYCYDLQPDESLNDKVPFLILHENQKNLANSLSSKIYVDKIRQDVNFFDYKNRLWSMGDSPLWQILFSKINWEAHELRQNEILDEINNFCKKELQLHLKNQEEILKKELQSLGLNDNSKNSIIEEEKDVKQNIPVIPLEGNESNDEEHKEDDQVELHKNMNTTSEEQKQQNDIKAALLPMEYQMRIIEFLYISADGRYNLGDELLLEKFHQIVTNKFSSIGFGVHVTAIRTFPTSDPVLSPCAIVKDQKINWNKIDVIVLGAGSTIRDQYLCQLSLNEMTLQKDTPILLWGSGFDDLLLLTSNRNIMGQLRSKDFSAISFLSTSKLVNSVNLLSSHQNIFGGVRGNYTHLFINRMLQEYPERHSLFPPLGEPGLLSLPKQSSFLSSKNFLKWKKPSKEYVMINFGIPTEGETHMYGQSQQSVGAVLDLLIKDISRNYQVVLYATHTSDIKHIQSLHQVVESMGVPESQLFVLPFIPDANDLLELLQKSSFSITFRYYAAVLSAYAETPFIALAYRFKIIEFCDSIGKSDYVIPTDRIDYPTLKNLISSIQSKPKDEFSLSIKQTKQEITKNYENILVNLGKYLLSNTNNQMDTTTSDTIKNLQQKRILFIGNVFTMNDRFIFYQFSHFLIQYFQINFRIYLTIEHMNAHWPSLQVWDKPIDNFDGVILCGFEYPHPGLSYLLDKINIPLLLLNSFPAENPNNRKFTSVEKIWNNIYNIPLPLYVNYPILLPRDSTNNELTTKSENKRKIGVYLSEIQSDFPYSDVSDTINMLCSVLIILSEEYDITIFTSEDGSLQDIDSIYSTISVSNLENNSLERFTFVKEILDVSIIDNDILKSMKLVITFSDFSSEICISRRTPFMQLISGVSSTLLKETNLQDFSVDLRKIRTPNSLLESIFLMLGSTEQNIQRLRTVSSTHEKKQLQACQLFADNLLK